MPRNIRKACCAAFSLALGSGPSSVAAQIDDADRAGAPAETREDRRYGKQLEAPPSPLLRSEEHTSELQSLTNLVCRLLLEKKKKKKNKKNNMNKEKHTNDIIN